MKSLCVYCTRTGITENIAKTVAQGTGAEFVRITDGKSRKGISGYLSICFDVIFKHFPELKPLKTEYPISEYERIIIAAPVWCEDLSFLAKLFLESHKDEFNCDIYIVATHMSGLSYEKKIKVLGKYSGEKKFGYLSLKTKGHDTSFETQEFINKLNKDVSK